MKLPTIAIVFALASAVAVHAQTPRDGARASFPVSPIQPDLTPGYVLIEGDIQVRMDEYLRLTLGGADGTYATARYWTGGVVPYEFVTSGTGSVSVGNQNRAIAAMNAIAQRAGVTFRPANAQDPDRIRFQNSSFNNSAVGPQGGAQIINILNWTIQIVICHEIYHSLGFHHEQSRWDRGSYVSINQDNICGSGVTPACVAAVCCDCKDLAGTCVPCSFNFSIMDASTYGPYDFDSFMHYGRSDFSCNGQDTITVLQPWTTQWQSVIGQSDHFSKLDELTCRGLYPFANDRWLRASATSPFDGTFHHPYRTISEAIPATPINGTLFVDPGTYAVAAPQVPLSRPMTIRATYGEVTITP